jgi:hypothetical protein
LEVAVEPTPHLPTSIYSCTHPYCPLISILLQPPLFYLHLSTLVPTPLLPTSLYSCTHPSCSLPSFTGHTCTQISVPTSLVPNFQYRPLLDPALLYPLLLYWLLYNSTGTIVAWGFKHGFHCQVDWFHYLDNGIHCLDDGFLCQDNGFHCQDDGFYCQENLFLCQDMGDGFQIYSPYIRLYNTEFNNTEL